MALLTYHETCPHCRRADAYLECVYDKAIRKVGHHVCWAVVFSCGSCAELVVVNVIDVGGVKRSPREYALNSSVPVLLNEQSSMWQRFGMYPEMQSLNAPEHTPEKIAKPFIEAKDNLARGHYETSELLCRKALDIATKALMPGTNDALNARINKLKTDQVITAEMADWAHIIRLEGNESAHSDDESTKEEAQELVDFTETFLLYAFTLPAMVRIKRGNAGHPQAANAQP
ncbi:DUF4145 domain-containing protein [Metapseudomonas otitidis]|uniref:DUF4145 domain-containing protein n=1 Tax=Metapseudomonas otitidis TaxID=319939 RepID=UPI0039FDC0FB